MTQRKAQNHFSSVACKNKIEFMALLFNITEERAAREEKKMYNFLNTKKKVERIENNFRCQCSQRHILIDESQNCARQIHVVALFSDFFFVKSI